MKLPVGISEALRYLLYLQGGNGSTLDTKGLGRLSEIGRELRVGVPGQLSGTVKSKGDHTVLVNIEYWCKVRQVVRCIGGTRQLGSADINIGCPVLSIDGLIPDQLSSLK